MMVSGGYTVRISMLFACRIYEGRIFVLDLSYRMCSTDLMISSTAPLFVFSGDVPLLTIPIVGNAVVNGNTTFYYCLMFHRNTSVPFTDRFFARKRPSSLSLFASFYGLTVKRRRKTPFFAVFSTFTDSSIRHRLVVFFSCW